MPTPFELGAMTGGNIAGGIQGASEKRRIDDILRTAAQSGDPAFIKDAIGQILRYASPENQQAGIWPLQQQLREQGIYTDPKENIAYQTSLANQQRNAQSLALKEQSLALRSKQMETKALEKIVPVKKALGVIAQIKPIFESGSLGPFWSGASFGAKGQTRERALMSAEDLKQREAYKKMSQSLISSVSNIGIRNQREFDELKAGLGDPKLPISKIKGAIEGIELMLKEELDAINAIYGTEQPQGQPQQPQVQMQSVQQPINQQPQEFSDEDLIRAKIQAGGDAEKAYKILTGQL